MLVVDSESFSVSSVEIKLKGMKQTHEQNLARAIKKQELLLDKLQYWNAKYPGNWVTQNCNLIVIGKT